MYICVCVCVCVCVCIYIYIMPKSRELTDLFRKDTPGFSFFFVGLLRHSSTGSSPAPGNGASPGSTP